MNVVTHGDKTIDSTMRTLKIQDLDIFVRDSNAIRILQKVNRDGAVNLDNYISAAKALVLERFLLRTLAFVLLPPTWITL